MKPIIAIRPEPGLSRTLAAGRKQGLAIEGVSLFEIRPLAWQPPPPGDFDALLIGSGNALRHAGPALAQYRALPVHAVGRETARAACEAGFEVARTGEGGLQGLLDGTDAALRYLRLAGRAHVPLAPPAGSTITLCIVYESAPLPMPDDLAETMRSGALVLLHSGEAARHFAGECDRLGIARARMEIAALAPRIVEAAGIGWERVRCAPSPEEGALLALAADMCH